MTRTGQGDLRPPSVTIALLALALTACPEPTPEPEPEPEPEPSCRPTLEACNELDDDCDGVIDEACLNVAEAAEWFSVWEGLDASRYCEPPFGGGEEAGITCDDALHLPPLELQSFFGLRRLEGLPTTTEAMRSAPVAAATEWILQATITITSSTPQNSTSFAYLGLAFEDDPVEPAQWQPPGIYLFPEVPVRTRYHEHLPAGGGQEPVQIGEPVQVTWIRSGNQLDLWVDGEPSGGRVVPAQNAAVTEAEIPADRFPSWVHAACIECTAVVEDWDFLIPSQPTDPDPMEPCGNRLRGGLEEFTDGVPHWWGAQGPGVLEDEGVVLPGAEDSRLVQPFVLPPRPCPTCADDVCGTELHLRLRARGGGTLNVSLAGEAADVPVQDAECTSGNESVSLACLPVGPTAFVTTQDEQAFDVVFAGCGFSDGPYPLTMGLLELWASDGDVVITEAQLQDYAPGLSCTPWRDLVRPTPGTPVMAAGVFVGESVTLRSLEGPAGEVRLHAEGDALHVEAGPGDWDVAISSVEGEWLRWTIRGDALHGPPGAIWSAGRFTWTEEGLPTRRVALVRRAEEPSAEAWLGHRGGAPGAPEGVELVWPEQRFPEPPVRTLSAGRVPRTFLLAPSDFALEELQGIGGLSAINPWHTEIPQLAADTAAAGIALELNTFLLHDVWRQEHLDTYDQWADAIPDEDAPVRWVVQDEPRVATLSRCRADLQSGGPFLPSMTEAAAAYGCTDGCDATAAGRACEAGLPASLNALAEHLRERIPGETLLSINLTAEGATTWGPTLTAFDDVSVTNNWIGRDVPHRWSSITWESLPGRLVAYDDVLGASQSLPTLRAPSATEFRAMAWYLLSLGADDLRHFVHPAGSDALTEAMIALREELDVHSDSLAAGRLLPAPRSTNSAVTTGLWSGPDEGALLAVINRSDRRQQAWVETEGADWLDITLEPFTVQVIER